MKKSLLILTAALTFGNMAAAQTAATASAPQVPALTDVPAGHWAKDAIDKLIERGILLGYPDGTFRGTQNLTRYEAAVIIARLLEQVQSGQTVISDAETVTALQNAVQELAADLAALGVRVTALEENAVSKEDFARLEERVNGLGTTATGGDAEALQGLQAQLDELTARADEYDTMRADIDDNASNIAALNDLTVLLNQDILDLQDRVTAVEAAQADFVQRADFDALNTQVGAIDTRVGKLETAPKFSVVGTVAPAYGRLALVAGTTNFDVDRLTVGTPQAYASAGFADGSVLTTDTATNYGTAGLGFGIRASQLTTANGLVTVNNAALNFGTTNGLNILGGGVGVIVSDASADGTINGQKFDVKYNATVSTFKFQNYLFNVQQNAGNVRGAVINVTGSTLPGTPKITAVIGNTNAPRITGQPSTVANNYYGLRLAYKPTGESSTFGVSAALVEGFRTAFGTDFDVKFGPVALKGEGVISSPSNGTAISGDLQSFVNNADKAAYIEARTELGPISFGANYRAIDPQFAVSSSTSTTPGASNAGMSTTSTLPYAANQVGYGAALGTNFGPVALGAYVDSRTAWNAPSTSATTGFGVKAGAKLAALELVGFYNSLSVGGVANDGTSDFLSSDFDSNRNAAGMGIAEVPFALTSSFGAQVSHDGAAENALVKGLNFTIGDAYFYNTRANAIYAYADYNTTLGGFTINPLARYVNVTDRDTTANNYNTLKYGVKLASPTLTGVPFQPSLYGNVVNRMTNDGAAFGTNATTTSELLGQAGIGFNSFIVDGVSAKLGYAYYQGTNVDPTVTADLGTGNTAFDASQDNIYSSRGAGKVQMDGIYTQIGWSGLTANYGIFRYNDLADRTKSSVAQGFKVSYSFKF